MNLRFIDLKRLLTEKEKENLKDSFQGFFNFSQFGSLDNLVKISVGSSCVFSMMSNVNISLFNGISILSFGINVIFVFSEYDEFQKILGFGFNNVICDLMSNLVLGMDIDFLGIFDSLLVEILK